MKTNWIYRILPWLVLFLLATNAGTLITLVRHLGGQHQSKEATEVSGEQIPDFQRTRFFTEELDLNADQQEHFRTLNQNFNRQANWISRDLDFYRQDLIRELGKAEPDKLKLDEISQGVGNKHKELKQATIDFYLGMKAFCNTEQKERLYELFQTLINTEGTSNTPRGPGPGQGRGPRSGYGPNQNMEDSVKQSE